MHFHQFSTGCALLCCASSVLKPSPSPRPSPTFLFSRFADHAQICLSKDTYPHAVTPVTFHCIIIVRNLRGQNIAPVRGIVARTNTTTVQNRVSICALHNAQQNPHCTYWPTPGATRGPAPQQGLTLWVRNRIGPCTSTGPAGRQHPYHTSSHDLAPSPRWQLVHVHVYNGTTSAL